MLMAFTFMVLAVPVFAQDASVLAPEVPEAVEWNAIIKALPTWIEWILTLLVVFVLPMLQFILKRIPTEESIKIKGWIGKILDALTFFQKDKIKGPQK